MNGGTVFDIGYQRYSGEREGRSRSRLGIYKDGVRIALGFGRGARAKVLPWLFVSILSLIALIMALMAGAATRIAGKAQAEAMNLPSHGDFYGIASVILFVFAALVAPELLCRDRRERVINLYLVRPITGGDYVAARWLAFFTIMVAAAWLPQLILLMGLVMGDVDPMAYLKLNWQDIPHFLLAGAAIAAYVTTLAMLTASFTTRRAYASVFLVGLFIISTPFTVGLASEMDGTGGQWVSMFNLTNIPLHVNDVIFGEVSMVTEEAPAGKLPAAILVAWYFAWTLIPGALLWHRYRRMTP